MTDRLIERLQASDPARVVDERVEARDAAIWDSLMRQATARPPQRRRRLLTLSAVVVLAVALLAVGLGRNGEHGTSFNAAAKTYHALQPKDRIYHFVSVSRLTEHPAGVAESYTTPFLFPPVGPSEGGRRLYHEIWLTPDGGQVRWLRFGGPSGVKSGLLKAYAFRQSPEQLVVGGPVPKQAARDGCPPQTLPPAEPASAFRVAYCAGGIVSKGAANVGGRAVWRFVSRPSKHGLVQEWLVDRATWLPVRYSYVDHNQQAGVHYTARLTVRFVKFEVLPLNGETRALMHLTAREREVCSQLRRQELERARKALDARRYRMAVRFMKTHQECR